MDTKQFEKRKADHITQSLNDKNEAIGLTGLDGVHLIHEALPDLDFKDIDISTHCFQKKYKTPFFVSGMTAGHEHASNINQVLAEVCQARGWIMGVGSQRRDLESNNQSVVDGWKEFRESFPDLTLVGNLGISQIINASLSSIEKVVKSLGGNALAIHLNAHQEVIQPEGTPHFKGGFKALSELCKHLSVPIIVKETGCGFSNKTLEKLSKLNVYGIDISGLGGTHWGRIEGARADIESTYAIAAKTFANWGESTVASVMSGRKVLPKNMEIWGSGGVRSGLDAAKLIALGATRVGYAKPALEAALKGTEAVHRWMEQQEFELKAALFCTGYATPKDLREGQPVTFGR